MNGHDSVLLDPTKVVLGEGRASEITDTESARFDELEKIFIVGHIARHIALPTSLHSHVTM